MKTIAYLGPQGTFSQEAAAIFSRHCCEESPLLKPYTSIFACAEAVEDNEADYAIVPLENSLEGSVNETLDILTTSLHLTIVAELAINIEHYLLTGPFQAEDIKKVYSHPQALAQCRGYLQRMLPHAVTIPAISTAEAAAIVVEQGAGVAAIASKRAADSYALHIVAAGIQDASSTTRFIALSHQRENFGAAVKTSLVFSVQNAAGSLYQVLRAFANYGVNLTRIESRPAKSRLGEYIFFVDIDGTADDLAVKTALREAGHDAVMLKLLGSYPVLDSTNV